MSNTAIPRYNILLILEKINDVILIDHTSDKGHFYFSFDINHKSIVFKVKFTIKCHSLSHLKNVKSLSFE